MKEKSYLLLYQLIHFTAQLKEKEAISYQINEDKIFTRSLASSFHIQQGQHNKIGLNK